MDPKTFSDIIDRLPTDETHNVKFSTLDLLALEGDIHTDMRVVRDCRSKLTDLGDHNPKIFRGGYIDATLENIVGFSNMLNSLSSMEYWSDTWMGAFHRDLYGIIEVLASVDDGVTYSPVPFTEMIMPLRRIKSYVEMLVLRKHRIKKELHTE